MVSRHTHTCTLVRLHSNLIWKSDGIRGVYVDVCVCTWGHFFLLTSCFFCALGEGPVNHNVSSVCRCVCMQAQGVNVCFPSQLQWGEIRSLQRRTQPQCTDGHPKHKKNRPLYLYDLHACVKRLRRPAAISVKVQRYEIENENSKKKKQRKR